MQRLISLSFLLLSSLILFAQVNGSVANEEAHTLFTLCIGFLFFVCVSFLFLGIYLYRKSRSNRRRIHDIRIDIKELREEQNDLRLFVSKLEKLLHEKPEVSNISKPKVEKESSKQIPQQEINPLHQRVKTEYPIIYDSRVKYASSVNLIDNSFFSVSDTPSDTTIFVLTIDKTNSQKATFRIYEGAFDKIRQVEHFLDNACNIYKKTSIGDGTWSKMFIQSEGVCIHVDAKWVVVDKIELELS